jgi:hypothetical protein
MIKIILNKIFYYGNFILFYFLIFHFFLKKIFPLLLEKYDLFKKNKIGIIKSIATKKNDFINLENSSYIEKKKLDVIREKIKLFLEWKKERNFLKKKEFLFQNNFFIRQKNIAKISFKKNVALLETKKNISFQVNNLFQGTDDINFLLSFFSKKERS